MSRTWAGLRRCTCGRVATRPAPAPCAYCAGDLHHGPSVVEDAEWLARTGETLDGALPRLGVSEYQLTAHLGAAGRTDVIDRLRRNQQPVNA